MSYRDYVLAAYLVFATVLLWDFVASRVRIAGVLRAARRLGARRATATATIPDVKELER